MKCLLMPFNNGMECHNTDKYQNVRISLCPDFKPREASFNGKLARRISNFRNKKETKKEKKKKKKEKDKKIKRKKKEDTMTHNFLKDM